MFSEDVLTTWWRNSSFINQGTEYFTNSPGSFKENFFIVGGGSPKKRAVKSAVEKKTDTPDAVERIKVSNF